KKWLGLRYRLIPFILGIIDDSARTGLPIQRMMPLCFPDDLQAHEYTEQFLLGPGLLVAPILDDGDIKTVYLPKGETWWDLNSGKSYEGGQVLNYKAGVETIPIFGRDGHMLCVGPSLSHLGDLNTARLLDEIWMFGMPAHNPVVM